MITIHLSFIDKFDNWKNKKTFTVSLWIKWNQSSKLGSQLGILGSRGAIARKNILKYFNSNENLLKCTVNMKTGYKICYILSRQHNRRYWRRSLASVEQCVTLTSLSLSVARVLTRIPMGSPHNVCCVSYTLSLIREISKQFVKLFKLGRSRL